MKFLCLLFSFYVILLSAKPCCADRECQEQSTPKKEPAQKKSTEKECQGCSPFYSCGNCAGFIVAKSITPTSALVSENVMQAYAPYQQPGIKEICLAIWQPPRLS